MPRSKKIRIVQSSPQLEGFKPYGQAGTDEKAIGLHLEEYEAIKLCDYEHLTHVEAADIMNVSRPTFTRVYQSARNKIAKAFVEGLPIIIKGGRSVCGVEWYSCGSCHINFSVRKNEDKACPFCQSKKTENI